MALAPILALSCEAQKAWRRAPVLCLSAFFSSPTGVCLSSAHMPPPALTLGHPPLGPAHARPGLPSDARQGQHTEHTALGVPCELRRWGPRPPGAARPGGLCSGSGRARRGLEPGPCPCLAEGL